MIAGGKGEQLSAEATIPYLYLNGKPVLTYSLQAFERCPEIDGVILIVDKERIESVTGMVQMFGCSKVKKLMPAAVHRQGSVISALKELDEEVKVVTIHDTSRPCITAEMISETVKAAKRYGSGVAAVALKDYVKEVEKGLTVKNSFEDISLWSVQSPQTFKKDVLLKGYEALAKKKIQTEDDSLAYEKTKESVHLVESKPLNIKIRTVDDLSSLTKLLKS
ncbi:MAG: hypothetical protein A2X46_13375 [Lentisphaerae bacterium GWF2_57_35]|nr:MAG: hypothetical protein A2X46_13375 [Lentisphaerae bacterium GWF2_57_35]